MESISGVSAGPFRGLKDALSEWTILQKKLVHTLGSEDAPWWYNERASISTFAAAVWLTGGVALKECMTSKKSLDKIIPLPSETEVAA